MSTFLLNKIYQCDCYSMLQQFIFIALTARGLTFSKMTKRFVYGLMIFAYFSTCLGQPGNSNHSSKHPQPPPNSPPYVFQHHPPQQGQVQVPPSHCPLTSQYDSDSSSPDLNSSLPDINDNSLDELEGEEEEASKKFPPHSFDKRVHIQKNWAEER